MYPIHDADPLLLSATTLAAKRGPAALAGIVAAAELIAGSLPSGQRLAESFASLSRNGLIRAEGDGFALTPASERLMADQPKKGTSDQRLFHLREALAAFPAKGAEAEVVVTTAALAKAVAAHEASTAGSAKNLLVPKPKEADRTQARPGQRQRKPLPARKRKA
jgi:hypothetical protein